MMRGALFIALSLTIIAGCVPTENETGPYELHVAGDTFFRLNKRSGEIVRFEGSKAFHYDEKWLSRNWRTPRNKTSKKLSGLNKFLEDASMWEELKVAWNEGHPLAIFQMGPYAEDIADALAEESRIEIRLGDGDHFQLETKVLEGSMLDNLVHIGSGKPFGWTYQWELSCNEATFSRIATWSAVFSNGDRLREAIQNNSAAFEGDSSAKIEKVKDLIKAKEIMGEITEYSTMVLTSDGFDILGTKLADLILDDPERFFISQVIESLSFPEAAVARLRGEKQGKTR